MTGNDKLQMLENQPIRIAWDEEREEKPNGHSNNV